MFTRASATASETPTSLEVFWVSKVTLGLETPKRSTLGSPVSLGTSVPPASEGPPQAVRPTPAAARAAPRPPLMNVRRVMLEPLVSMVVPSLGVEAVPKSRLMPGFYPTAEEDPSRSDDRVDGGRRGSRRSKQWETCVAHRRGRGDDRVV